MYRVIATWDSGAYICHLGGIDGYRLVDRAGTVLASGYFAYVLDAAYRYASWYHWEEVESGR